MLNYLILDRQMNDPGALWLSFQAAAGTVTALYKGKKNTIILIILLSFFLFNFNIEF